MAIKKVVKPVKKEKVKFDFKTIETFEIAYAKADKKTKKEYDDSTGGTPDEVAYRKLKLVYAAIRNGVILDYTNPNQKKWGSWFDLSSGCRFVSSHYYYGSTVTDFGPRLCTDKYESAVFGAKQFIDLWTIYLTK